MNQPNLRMGIALTRRAVVRTGGRIAYASPVIAATLRLTAGNARAAVETVSGDGAPAIEAVASRAPETVELVGYNLGGAAVRFKSDRGVLNASALDGTIVENTNTTIVVSVPAGTVISASAVETLTGRVTLAHDPVTVRSAADTKLQLASEAGVAGDEVVVAGAGFEPGPVDLLWDGEAVASGKVGGKGAFRLSFVVPEGAEAGVHAVAARDDADRTGSAPFRVVDVAAEPDEAPTEPDPGGGATATARLDAAATDGGVAIAGRGFAPGEVAIAWDGEPLAVATAGQAGAFRLRVAVPDGAAPGDHAISAEDGAGTRVETRYRLDARRDTVEPTAEPSAVTDPAPEAEATADTRSTVEAEPTPEAGRASEAERAPESDPLPETGRAPEADPTPEATRSPEADPGDSGVAPAGDDPAPRDETRASDETPAANDGATTGERPAEQERAAGGDGSPPTAADDPPTAGSAADQDGARGRDGSERREDTSPPLEEPEQERPETESGDEAVPAEREDRQRETETEPDAPAERQDERDSPEATNDRNGPPGTEGSGSGSGAADGGANAQPDPRDDAPSANGEASGEERPREESRRADDTPGEGAESDTSESPRDGEPPRTGDGLSGDARPGAEGSDKASDSGTGNEVERQDDAAQSGRAAAEEMSERDQAEEQRARERAQRDEEQEHRAREEQQREEARRAQEEQERAEERREQEQQQREAERLAQEEAQRTREEQQRAEADGASSVGATEAPATQRPGDGGPPARSVEREAQAATEARAETEAKSKTEDRPPKAGAEAQALIRAKATLELSQESGQAGDGVTVDGEGFVPGKVEVTWDGGSVASAKATGKGTFRAKLKVPKQADEGRHIVGAKDSAKKTAETEFRVTK